MSVEVFGEGPHLGNTAEGCVEGRGVLVDQNSNLDRNIDCKLVGFAFAVTRTQSGVAMPECGCLNGRCATEMS